MVRATNPGPKFTGVTVTIASSLAEEYDGEFHVFLRGYVYNGAASTMSVDVWATTTDTAPATSAFYRSGDVAFAAGTDFELIDLGKARIDSKRGGTVSADVVFSILLTGNGATDCDLYDLILMPVDEWACDALDTRNDYFSRVDRYLSAGTYYPRYLDIDGLTYPKQTSALVKDVATDQYILPYYYVSPGDPIVQANARQRLWFLCVRYDATGTIYNTADPEITNRIQISRTQRYYSRRGSA
jgi:hypothetical protein